MFQVPWYFPPKKTIALSLLVSSCLFVLLSTRLPKMDIFSGVIYIITNWFWIISSRMYFSNHWWFDKERYDCSSFIFFLLLSTVTTTRQSLKNTQPNVLSSKMHDINVKIFTVLGETSVKCQNRLFIKMVKYANIQNTRRNFLSLKYRSNNVSGLVVCLPMRIERSYA